MGDSQVFVIGNCPGCSIRGVYIEQGVRLDMYVTLCPEVLHMMKAAY